MFIFVFLLTALFGKGIPGPSSETLVIKKKNAIWRGTDEQGDDCSRSIRSGGRGAGEDLRPARVGSGFSGAALEAGVHGRASCGDMPVI